MTFEFKGFNKGFSLVKSLIDEINIQYTNEEVLDPSWTSIGGMYLEILETPVYVEVSDNEKQFMINIESIEGNLVSSKTKDREIVKKVLKNIYEADY